MKTEPLKAVIVGAGHRAITYANYCKDNPDKLTIVGVADPLELRRKKTAELYTIPAENVFEDAQALAGAPKFADFVINGTMDHQHVPTSIPLLEAGYDMLLEKPFATNADELWDLVRVAVSNKRKVAICHVLRYAPFYAAVRKLIADGEVGEVINIQATEHVSYHHVAVGFVRGKWNNRDRCKTSMLVQKSCHDLDIISWMLSGNPPVRVASFGSNFQFRPEKAPEGAGNRCLVDCPIEKDCLYSARKHYIDHPERWSFYVWDSIEHIENPTIEDKIESLKTDNPYGRCVWKCDNNVVDHQSIVIEFEDGATATLNMIGGCSKPGRSIHVIGTTGEIQGNMGSSEFTVRHFDTRPGKECSEKAVNFKEKGDMTGAFGAHGGGDLRMVHDFVSILNGEEPSISSTHIEDSIYSHLLAFYADQSMEEGRGVPVPKIADMIT